MILQSHQGYLDILPALPTAIPTGSIKGLQARGGFDVDLSWENGTLTSFMLKSKTGGDCTLHYKNLVVQLHTKAGETYKLNGDLK
ncbi:hypothetical protein D3C85_1176920 [compost metagenome]